MNIPLLCVVAAYHVFVCVLFLVQEGMWTGYSQSTYLPEQKLSKQQYTNNFVQIIQMYTQNKQIKKTGFSTAQKSHLDETCSVSFHDHTQKHSTR
jgi:hypothetical protein